MRQKILEKAELPLETTMLIIAGTTLLIAGALLFPIHAGVQPYYENGLYGLLLFFFALQILMLGRTPFGDLPVSHFLIAVGVFVSGAGIVTCVIPGISNQIARTMLFLCLVPGGGLLLLQMLFSPDKLRLWLRIGGVVAPLPFACGAVYLLSMLAGLLLVKPDLLTGYATAATVLIYGAAVLNLARVLAAVYREYPEASKEAGEDGGLPFDKSMLLLTGIFMILLGFLLLPVNLGLLPFSPSAQLGLLMVIFAVQMLAAGNTPIGVFPRSRLVILLGMVFAGLGIVSCIVPGILAAPLRILVGVLNIVNGGITLGKCVPPLLKFKLKMLKDSVPPVLLKLYWVQIALGALAMLFGSSMLVPGVIPGLAIGVILAANGGVLLYLIRVLFFLEALQNATGETHVPDGQETAG